jgi:hypothetical protein
MRHPLDEKRLQIVRAFLRQHFPNHEVTEQFDFDKTAQRFKVEDEGTRHILVVPKAALEDAGVLETLLTDSLVEALKRAGAAPMVLTAKGLLPEPEAR